MSWFKKQKYESMIVKHAQWLAGLDAKISHDPQALVSLSPKGARGRRLNLDNLDVRCIKEINAWSLQYASAVNADFSYIHFKSVTFSNADFRGARFSFAYFENCDLTESDFTGANFSGAKMVGAYCTSSNFRNANFDGADLSLASIHSCDLTGADFFNANLTKSTIRRSIYTTEFKNAAMMHGMRYDEEKFGVLATNEKFLLNT